MVLRLLDRTRSLYRLADLGMPARLGRDVLEHRHRAVRHGDRRRPDRQRQDHDALRDVVGDQPHRHQRDDDRRPGRVHLPAGQPDPDPRTGRPDVRHRSEVDPAPGPRRDPRRRGPRRRDRAHRGAVGADRPPRVLVDPRDRRGLVALPPCSTWASSRSSSPPRSSAWSRSVSCAAPARRAASTYEPTLSELTIYREARRPGEGRLAARRRVASTARAPATSTGSACTKCSRSPTSCASAWSTARRRARPASSRSQQGLRTLQNEAVQLVAGDVTTMEEVVKHVLVNEGLE